MYLNKQEIDGSLDRLTKKESLIVEKRKAIEINNINVKMCNYY